MYPFRLREVMQEMIYADNAATTKLDIDAFEAMKPFLLESYANPSQPYSFSRNAKKAIKEARQIIASCIGADPEEIVFTSCGTESDNWAIKMGLGEGNRVVTSVIEHHAVLNSCLTLERQGRKVTYVPVDKNGIINIDYVGKCMKHDGGLLSVMFANNEIGSIQPIKELVSIAHEHGYLFHTDAVQAVGHVEIDVHHLGIDMLSASAHKFNGPKGIGFLYVKKGIDINAYIDGGVQERGRRAGTENVAAIVGMAEALKKNCQEMVDIGNNLKHLTERLLDGLAEAGVDFIRNGSKNGIPGNISLSFRGYEGESLLHRLDLMGICVSTGSACDSVNTQISHVIKAIEVPEEYAKGTIRISLGRDNTEDDVDQIIRCLIRIVQNREIAEK